MSSGMLVLRIAMRVADSMLVGESDPIRARGGKRVKRRRGGKRVKRGKMSISFEYRLRCQMSNAKHPLALIPHRKTSVT